MVLLRGRRPVPGADAPGRSHGPLSRRERFLRFRPGALAALQSDPHLAPSTGYLLRGLPPTWPLAFSWPRWSPAASRAASACCPSCCWRRWSSSWCRQPGRRGGQLQGLASPGARPSSAPRAGSTSTSAGSGKSSSIAGWSCGALFCIAVCAATGRREPRQPALPVLLQRPDHPAVLCRGTGQPLAHQLRHRRLLALLGGPSLGRGLSGAVHHDHGGLHLRPARAWCRRRRRRA